MLRIDSLFKLEEGLKYNIIERVKCPAKARECCVLALRELKTLLDCLVGTFCLVYKFSSLEVFKEKLFNFYSGLIVLAGESCDVECKIENRKCIQISPRPIEGEGAQRAGEGDFCSEFLLNVIFELCTRMTDPNHCHLRAKLEDDVGIVV